MQINKTKFVIFHKVISGFKIRLKEEVYMMITKNISFENGAWMLPTIMPNFMLTSPLFCIFTTHKLIKRLHDNYRF